MNWIEEKESEFDVRFQRCEENLQVSNGSNKSKEEDSVENRSLMRHYEKFVDPITLSAYDDTLLFDFTKDGKDKKQVHSMRTSQT